MKTHLPEEMSFQITFNVPGDTCLRSNSICWFIRLPVNDLADMVTAEHDRTLNERQSYSEAGDETETQSNIQTHTEL